MIARLLELFEGPEAPGPWTPPAVPAALHTVLPWRAFDESSELYVNAGSVGFAIELPPFAGIDAETLGALAGTLADAAPERCTSQIVHWASPRFGAASRAWAEPRGNAGGALARMGSGRRDLLAPGGWRRLHGGGPPFTLSDYRVFVTACLAGGMARSATPGPAAETALGAFRRALEGTLASAGAQTRLGGALGVAVAPGERGAVSLIPKARKPHPRLVAGSAAVEAHGGGGERHAEDPADGLEILVDEVVPLP